MKYMKLIRNGALVIGLYSLLAGCAVPGGPGSAATGKVILHTPYGASSRAVDGGYYQSTVLPQNLEAVLATFVVTLSGGPGGPFTQTVTFDQASQFVFDNVPQGQWDLAVEGLNSFSQVVAKGVYPNFVSVSNGQLTDIADLITVSPTRPVNPGPESGEFTLTLRQVPGAVKSVSLDYRVVFINPDGSFYLPDRLVSAPDILVSSLSMPNSSGHRTLNIRTNTSRYGGIYNGEQTGTMLLTVKFQNDDGTLVHTFQPVFTIDIYQNLESSLDLTLPADVSNSSSPPATNLSVTTDVDGNAIVHWGRPAARNYVTAYQIGQTPVGSNALPTPGEILTSLPNLGNLNDYNTGINLAQQPGSSAQFWVRTISAGLYLSPWVSVTAVSNLTPGDPFNLYVSPVGSDAADGSQNTPFATIQKAIDAAQLRGNFGQETRIHVAEGTFNLSQGLINAPRNVDGIGGVEPAVPISLLGGYYSNFSLRGDPVNHPTVLHDTRTTGDAASQWAEIFYDQQGSPSLPTPQTIDGFTIEQNTSGDPDDFFQGVSMADVVNINLTNLVIRQTSPATGPSSFVGIQVTVNRTYANPSRSLVISRNQIFQRAPGATNADPSGAYFRGVVLGNAATGVVVPSTVTRVDNNVIVTGPTNNNWVSINWENLTSEVSFRNNTLVFDPISGKPAVVFGEGTHRLDNNLVVSLNPGYGVGFFKTTTSGSPTFRNNVVADATYFFWDYNIDVSLAAVNSLGGSSANQSVAASAVHFTNPPAGNYRLTTDTDVAVLRGGINGSSLNPPWPNTDLGGTVRTGDWTVGAYETDVTLTVAMVLGDGGGNDNWGLILKDDGSLLGTGQGGDGRVGGVVGNTTFGSVSPGFSVGTIAVGAHASYALNTSGDLYSAGNGSQGALGHGDGSTKLVFTQVPGLSGVTQVSGGGDTSFARLSNGDLYASGWNNYGQTGLPLGTSQYNSFTLTASNVLKGVSGYYHSALVKTDGTAWAAGQGNLGDGTYHDGTSPGWYQVLTAVATPLTNVVEVAAGFSFDAYLDSSGQLWTTGNSPVGSSSYATMVASDVKAVYAGQSNSSAILLILKNDDTLWYAGSNWFQYFDGSWQSTYGLIGNGNVGTSPISVFTQVATNVASAAAGSNQWGYVAKNGEVWVNGSNGSGGIGLGSGTIYVTTLTKVVLP